MPEESEAKPAGATVHVDVAVRGPSLHLQRKATWHLSRLRTDMGGRSEVLRLQLRNVANAENVPSLQVQLSGGRGKGAHRMACTS